MHHMMCSWPAKLVARSWRGVSSSGDRCGLPISVWWRWLENYHTTTQLRRHFGLEPKMYANASDTVAVQYAVGTAVVSHRRGVEGNSLKEALWRDTA